MALPVDNVIYPGPNGKMIEIAAAMELLNLDAIDRAIDSIRHNYRTYQRELAELPSKRLLPFDETERNNYQYVAIEIDAECPINRDRIIDALHAENILARKYFWPGCHQMQLYRELPPMPAYLLPKTEKVAGRVIVMPTGSTINDKIVSTVASVIRVLMQKDG